MNDTNSFDSFSRAMQDASAFDGNPDVNPSLDSALPKASDTAANGAGKPPAPAEAMNSNMDSMGSRPGDVAAEMTGDEPLILNIDLHDPSTSSVPYESVDSQNPVPALQASDGVDPLNRFLWRHFKPEDLIELRAIETWEGNDGRHQSRPASRIWIRLDQFPDLLENLERMNRDERVNVFFGVNPRRTSGGRKEDVKSVRFLWADLDGGVTPDEARRRIVDAGLPPATMLVNSGHGVHCYWELAQDFPLNGRADIQRVETLVRRIGELIDGDNVQDVSRCLRLPGFLNVKNARNGQEPVPCTLVEVHEEPAAASLDEFEQMMPVDFDPPATPNQVEIEHETSGEMSTEERSDRCWSALFRIPIDPNESDGSSRLVRCARQCVRYDLTEDAAVDLIREYAEHHPFPVEYSDDEIVQRIRDAEGRTEPGSALRDYREDETPSGSQATGLIQLIDELQVELFHDADRTGYARFQAGDHFENHALDSSEFQSWLSWRYQQQHDQAPGQQAMTTAIQTLKGRARFQGTEQRVFLRVGEHDGRIYLDLADDRWRAVEIDPGGWRVVDDPPVRFRRGGAMLPLPEPQIGGSMAELRQLLNLNDDHNWTLLASWLMGTVWPNGPYPVLVLRGEQGSAKSTTARILRALVDPSRAPLRSLPSDDRDAAVTARNNWYLVFDNISSVSHRISDLLSRLATGGGHGTRRLFTDDEEQVFDATRPIVLNGIEEFVTRSDLLDRALIIELEPIPEDRRRPEAQLCGSFEEARPRILGALLDALSAAMRNLPTVMAIERAWPRMADFAQRSVAAESALGLAQGAFDAAYRANRQEAVDVALEANPVAQAVIQFMQDKTTWQGTATGLLQALSPSVFPPRVGQTVMNLPKQPNVLSNLLMRAAPDLRQHNIEVGRIRQSGGTRNRLITLKCIGVSDSQTASSGLDAGQFAIPSVPRPFIDALSKLGHQEPQNDQARATSAEAGWSIWPEAGRAGQSRDDGDDEIVPAELAACPRIAAHPAEPTGSGDGRDDRDDPFLIGEKEERVGSLNDDFDQQPLVDLDLAFLDAGEEPKGAEELDIEYEGTVDLG